MTANHCFYHHDFLLISNDGIIPWTEFRHIYSLGLTLNFTWQLQLRVKHDRYKLQRSDTCLDTSVYDQTPFGATTSDCQRLSLLLYCKNVCNDGGRSQFEKICHVSVAWGPDDSRLVGWLLYFNTSINAIENSLNWPNLCQQHP